MVSFLSAVRELGGGAAWGVEEIAQTVAQHDKPDKRIVDRLYANRLPSSDTLRPSMQLTGDNWPVAVHEATATGHHKGVVEENLKGVLAA
jgi:hypothetical protein